jgi:hypothetical protein
MAQVITGDVFSMTREFNSKPMKGAFVCASKRAFYQLPRLQFESAKLVQHLGPYIFTEDCLSHKLASLIDNYVHTPTAIF